jgi:hypothetical protein
LLSGVEFNPEQFARETHETPTLIRSPLRFTLLIRRRHRVLPSYLRHLALLGEKPYVGFGREPFEGASGRAHDRILSRKGFQFFCGLSTQEAGPPLARTPLAAHAFFFAPSPSRARFRVGVFGCEWELQTPMGRFRLIRSRGEAEFKPSENDRWALLFFTKCAFETKPDARYAMLALRARIEGTPFDPQRADEYFSVTECREMERCSRSPSTAAKSGSCH